MDGQADIVICMYPSAASWWRPVGTHRDKMGPVRIVYAFTSCTHMYNQLIIWMRHCVNVCVCLLMYN